MRRAVVGGGGGAPAEGGGFGGGAALRSAGGMEDGGGPGPAGVDRRMPLILAAAPDNVPRQRRRPGAAEAVPGRGWCRVAGRTGPLVLPRRRLHALPDDEPRPGTFLADEVGRRTAALFEVE